MVAIAPTATRTPKSVSYGAATLNEEFALPAVLIGLADLSDDASVENEGYEQDSDALSRYTREVAW